jgi:DNA-3-methyladenine glycosylase I
MRSAEQVGSAPSVRLTPYFTACHPRVTISHTMPTPPTRCSWSNSSPLMSSYHDEEWGVPLHDSRMLWEMLMLEGFQAGLSWNVILNKREGFRRAFKGFEPAKVAKFTEKDVEQLMQDPGIVRARAKIEATIAGGEDLSRHAQAR